MPSAPECRRALADAGAPSVRSMLRRRLLTAATCALALPVRAQGAYPQRPVRFIVPNAPGSSIDVIGRITMTEMAKLLRQPAVADNRAGAAGALGVEIGRTSPPDGYTLIVGSTSAISAAPLLQKAVAYDPMRDFEFIGLAALLPNVLVCNPQLPVKSAAEFIAYAKASPRELNMASAGIGSASHLAGVAFLSAAGFRSLHVPYKGGSQGVASVVSGECDWVLTPAPAAMSLVSGGRVRLLGHSMAENAHPVGDAPSLALTVPGFEFSGWIGLLGPKGLPAPIIATVGDALAQALRQPELRKAFDTNGAVPTSSTPAEFRAFVVRDIAQNRRAIEIAGIQPE